MFLLPKLNSFKWRRVSHGQTGKNRGKKDQHNLHCYKIDQQMIDHDKKFIFVHIPKTGGSSIEAIFHPSIITENDICKDIKGKHNTLSNIIKNESLDVLDYFKFSFVRNPWAKILSHYLFFIKGGFDHRNSFVDFVDYYCGRDQNELDVKKLLFTWNYQLYLELDFNY